MIPASSASQRICGCHGRRGKSRKRVLSVPLFLIFTAMVFFLGISIPRFICSRVPTVVAFGSLPLTPRTPRSRMLSIPLTRSATSSSDSDIPDAAPKNIAIVGGGLAGLSTAFHLIEQQASKNGSSRGGPLKITILDKASGPGTGGASAVAGGLVHPLSPRGKLIHWGREGLEATNYLIDQACAATATDDIACGDTIVLRSELFRLATSPKQAEQLQQTAQNLSEFCEWKETFELPGTLTEDSVFGGLRLYNGCKVLHLPSYLKGLWAACKSWQDSIIDLEVQWEQLDEASDLTSPEFLNKYTAVVWAAGSGLFESDDFSRWLLGSSLPEESKSPVQLVRGQSIELRLPKTTKRDTRQQALLSGKYVCPLPDPQCILVGATHEFQADPLSRDEVKRELQERTQSFSPSMWEEDAVVERFTEGTRVQSQRGSKGRLPIVGKLAKSDSNLDHWIFTGLSSRGLLYHGVYGKLLAKAISEESEQCLETQCHGFDWWRHQK